jgi:putative NTP pyrophosphohydrolase including oxidative damage repair enzyme
MNSLLEYKKLMSKRPELFKNNDDHLIIVKDFNILEKYSKENKKKIGVIYSSEFHFFVVDLVHKGDKNYFLYERLISKDKGIGTAMLTIYKDKFILLKQFRHSMRDFQYAIPRGFGTEGLSGEENAKKELFEELGTVSNSITYLGKMTVDSGISNKEVFLYKCLIDNIRLKKGYEGIDNIYYLSQKKMEKWISEGKITDSFTIIAYNFYKNLL